MHIQKMVEQTDSAIILSYFIENVESLHANPYFWMFETR